jgi:membrane associated rhomboid family serine protease
MVLAVSLILGLAYYVMTPDERTRVHRTARSAFRRVTDSVMHDASEPGPFHEALSARTSYVLVTPALVALNMITFAIMLASAYTLSDLDTLVAWGGNFGPRTTNGEWWRLVTATFVHSGMLHLLVNVGTLVQVGLILERLVGHVAVGAVYLASGVLASLVSLAGHPVDVLVGASGAVFGLFGLLLASLIWGMVHRSPTTIPLGAVKRLAATAGVFVLYHAWSHGNGSAGQIAGLVVGFVSGIVLARGIGERKPSVRRTAALVTATAAIAVVTALPLRGVADIRPEIARVVAVEDRTAHAYEKAVGQFTLGALKADALAQVIDRTIVPELETVHGHLTALQGVPREHQALAAIATAFLSLREESWRLRAHALRKGNMLALRRADQAERASLDALHKFNPTDQQ